MPTNLHQKISALYTTDAQSGESRSLPYDEMVGRAARTLFMAAILEDPENSIARWEWLPEQQKQDYANMGKWLIDLLEASYGEQRAPKEMLLK